MHSSQYQRAFPRFTAFQRGNNRLRGRPSMISGRGLGQKIRDEFFPGLQADEFFSWATYWLASQSPNYKCLQLPWLHRNEDEMNRSSPFPCSQVFLLTYPSSVAQSNINLHRLHLGFPSHCDSQHRWPITCKSPCLEEKRNYGDASPMTVMQWLMDSNSYNCTKAVVYLSIYEMFQGQVTWMLIYNCCFLFWLRGLNVLWEKYRYDQFQRQRYYQHE